MRASDMSFCLLCFFARACVVDWMSRLTRDFADVLGVITTTGGGIHDEVARARTALDAAEALVDFLLKTTTLKPGSINPDTLHADAPELDQLDQQLRLDTIESLILCGTLSSLEKAAQLMEHGADTCVCLSEFTDRAVIKIVKKLEHGMVDDDLRRAEALLKGFLKSENVGMIV